MTMTDEELLRELRQAKDPAAHVRVLADLNCVPEREMRERLRDLGADLPPVRKRVRKMDEAAARKLLESGKTDAEAARALGVRKDTFGTWRRAHGLPCNRDPRDPAAMAPRPKPDAPAEQAEEPPAVPSADAAELCGGADVVQAWAVVAGGRPALYLRRREIAEAVQALIELDKNLREE